MRTPVKSVTIRADIRCPLHPSYMARRFPTSKDSRCCCRFMWYITQTLKEASVAVTQYEIKYNR